MHLAHVCQILFLEAFSPLSQPFPKISVGFFFLTLILFSQSLQSEAVHPGIGSMCKTDCVFALRTEKLFLSLKVQRKMIDEKG